MAIETVHSEAKILSWNRATRELLFAIGDSRYQATVIPHESNMHLFHVILHGVCAEPILVNLGPDQASPALETRQIQAAVKTTICAPLAGRIISCNIEPNQPVTKNQRLLVIESMKMENEIVAESEGIVQSIFITAGDMVAAEQKLIEIKPT